MPLRKTDQGWYWGSKGPFDTKTKALAVARAAYASGYKEENEMAQNEVAAQFVQCLLHAVTNTHILHLKSRSYSEHMALGDFYDGLSDLADTYAEAYQGKYGIIEGYTDDFELADSAIPYLMEKNDYIKLLRAGLPQDSELQNIIDEIVALIDSTLYKLVNLK
jgi:hypothetical protein